MEDYKRDTKSSQTDWEMSALQDRLMVRWQLLEFYNYDHGEMEGVLYNGQYPDGKVFHHFFGLVILLESMAEWSEAKKEEIKHRTFWQGKACLPKKWQTQRSLARCQVEIVFRRHDSLQGWIRWKQEQVAFRSELELLQLLNEILQDSLARRKQ